MVAHFLDSRSKSFNLLLLLCELCLKLLTLLFHLAVFFQELVEEQSAGTLYAMQKRRTRNIMPQGSASQSVDI